MSANRRWNRVGIVGIIILACVLSASALAQEGVPEEREETHTNSTVIEMHELGLGAEVLIEKIEGSRCDFDTSLAGLKSLKDAGVPDAVIVEMIRAMEEQEQFPYLVGFEGNPHDPTAPHDSGIYLYEERDGVPQMTKLEPNAYTATKTGGFLKQRMTFGASKIKSKAVLSRAHAQVQTSDPRPTFYFYFTETTSDLSHSGNVFMGLFGDAASTSPNEFVLVKTNVKEKKNCRELVVGQVSAYGGIQSGVRGKDAVFFEFEKIGPGVYRVVPKEDLEDGEYSFFYGGTPPAGPYGSAALIGGGKVFDFGVGRQ